MKTKKERKKLPHTTKESREIGGDVGSIIQTMLF
jgi:hypothetical protein